MKLRGQLNRVTAVFDKELRDASRAIGNDLIERALKLSCSGQYSRDAVEHTEVRFFVSVRAGYGGMAPEPFPSGPLGGTVTCIATTWTLSMTAGKRNMPE